MLILAGLRGNNTVDVNKKSRPRLGVTALRVQTGQNGRS